MKMKKLIALLCAGTTLFSVGALGGCDNNKKENYDPLNEDQIKIMVSNLGYGVEHISQIAKAFENTHPGKSVIVEDTVLSPQLISQLEAGSFIGDICMFNDDVLWKKWRSGMMTPLNDVVETKPDGEDKTVGEKTVSLETFQMDNGNYYSLPWMNSISSYAYNKTALDTLLGAGKWELPKTTSELWTMCDAVQAKGGYGFVWEGSYLGGAFDAYMAQYNGAEMTTHYYEGEYFDETTQEWKLSDAENVQFISMNTGYLRAAEQVEKMIRQYSHKYSRNMSYIQAQAAFAGIGYADDKKLSAFMPNGDWMYHETKDYFDSTGHQPGFMRMPIISDIVETLAFYEDGTTAYSALSAEKKSAYDITLRAIIDYVDGETQTIPQYKGANVSDTDIQKIRDARAVISGSAQDSMFIPSNSKKVALAKEFIVFMASDMAVNIYSQYTNGLSPWVTDTTFSNISFDVPFMQDVLSVVSLSKAFAKPHNELSLYFPKTTSFDQGFGAGTHTAKMVWENDVKWYKEQWPTILKNAGLSNN